MASAIPILRAVLIALAAFFGLGLGRSLALRARPRLATWMLRLAAVMLGICWRSVDLVAVAAVALAAAGVALGYFQGKHPPREEHLEDLIFPKE
ncbi:MAG: hypothetical protein NTY38_24855 [Acidobacteria bacterium]|nr:hypothetical protein [Acidobacteriota bacterium]